jgi:aryl-alcohol dehydrogenase-like predicted oxidoreductase
MHHVDRETPWEEIWQAMEQLVYQGKVLYVGSSNFAGWQIACANGSAACRNFMGLVSEQSLYNLSARMVELEVVPACRALGLGLLPWGPLGGGLLSGGLGDMGEGRRGSDRARGKVEKHREQLESYEALCRDVGATPANVAVAWLLHNPAVTAPILGPRTLDQLTGAVEALEIALSADHLSALDQIWPGPGGEAPESYAW